MTHQDGVHVAEQIPRALALEDENVEEAVVRRTVAEHLEGTSVESPVPEQDEGSVPNCPVAALHANLQWLLTGDLGKREQVAQGAECLFGFPGGAADDLSVETDSGQLDEAARSLLRRANRQVELPDLSAPDDLPGLLWGIERNSKLDGEDVHGSDRENPERNTGIAGRENTVHHFVDGAVPSGGDDGGESLPVPDSLSSDPLGITGRGTQANLRTTAQITEALGQPAGLIAMGCWIQDDERILHTSQLLLVS